MRESEGRFDLIIAALAGLAAVALVIGTLAVEQIQVTHEIQLWAPARVQAGDEVPVRVRVFADLDTHDGPRVVQPATTVGLYTHAETLDADPIGELEPAAFDTLEGSAGLAESASARVVTVAREGNVLATAERPVELVEATRDRLAERARISDSLQLLSLARPAAVLEAAPELEVAVPGGVCVPEIPCQLVFLRGAQPIVPRLAECVGADVGATSIGTELVSIDVTVHGSEARCDLALDPLPVATTIQLPVALATPWIRVEHEEDILRVTGEPPIGRDEMFVDVFVGERWVAARTMRRDEPLLLPLEAIVGGLVRVQVRADLDSSERAYQVALLARHPSQSASVEADAIRARFGEASASWSRERLRWALMSLEVDPIDVVAPISGLENDEARLASVRGTMRVICGVGVLLGVLAILVAVLRRGFASAREARAVLLEAGDAAADGSTARWRSWLTVVAFVSAIGLAILLGAAFLVARPFFMG